MPRNGSGVYTPPANSVNPAVPDTEINADDFNAMLSDLSEAMTDSIAADGQTTITANLPMSGFKLTGVGLATTLGDALSYGRAANVTALVATTFNGNTWTAGTGTLTLGAGKTATVSNTLTFTGTDGSSVNFGAGGTVLYSGGSYVSSIAGTANEITASAATGAVTLSLPTSLTFTGKTITGGTYASVSSITASGAIQSATLAAGGTVPSGVAIYGVLASGEGTPTYDGSEVSVFQRNAVAAQSVSTSLVAGTTGQAAVYFGDKDNNKIGKVLYDNSNNSMVLTTNGTTALTISSAQAAAFAGVITSTKLTVTTSGTSGVISTQSGSGDYCFTANAFANSGSYYYAAFNGGTGGSIVNNGTITTYAATSDSRFKDWENVPQHDYWGRIEKLWVGDFHIFDSMEKSGKPHQGFGVLAQQAYEVLGTAFGLAPPPKESDRWQAPSEPFAFLALWAVKHLKAENDALKGRVSALEGAGR